MFRIPILFFIKTLYLFQNVYNRNVYNSFELSIQNGSKTDLNSKTSLNTSHTPYEALWDLTIYNIFVFTIA